VLPTPHEFGYGDGLTVRIEVGFLKQNIAEIKIITVTWIHNNGIYVL
jgi:hypothetical protein